MFHLMPTPQGSFYVLNDIFRLNYAWRKEYQSVTHKGRSSNVARSPGLNSVWLCFFRSRTFEWELGIFFLGWLCLNINCLYFLFPWFRDLLCCGWTDWWKDAFLDTCFSVSINELGVGDLKTSVNSVSVRLKDLHLMFENSFNAYCLPIKC